MMRNIDLTKLIETQYWTQ